MNYPLWDIPASGLLIALVAIIHVFISHFAVGGGLFLVLAERKARRESDQALLSDAGRWAQRFGAQAAAWATGINVIVGLWWLAALPAATLQRFIGGDIVATSLFAFGVVGGLGTLAILIVLALPGPSFRLALGGAGGTLITVVTMLLVRDQVRVAALDRLGFAHTTWMVPQWGPFGLFALLLVGALGIVGWMTALFLRSAPAKETIAPAA